MARPYDRDWGMRDESSWGDRRERDERRFRSGDERGRYGEGRYGEERWRAEGQRYGGPDWDRERYREAPEYGREQSYGWSSDRGHGQQGSARDREWGWSQYGSDERGRYGQDYYTARGFGTDYAPNANRWDPRYDHAGRTTLPGMGWPDEQERGRAFNGWHSQQTNRGGFFGKGPRGYTRPDDRIREDVCDRLSFDDELDASDITVTVDKGEVTLEGTVSDRHSKRRAEDISESVLGVSEVHNRLRSNKGLMQEVGDKLMGRETESSGHAGSGTRNSPATYPNQQNNH